MSDLCFHCASGPNQDPLTRTHVRLLGPCFKTGRVGDRSTRREPPAPHRSRTANKDTSPRATKSFRAQAESSGEPLPRLAWRRAKEEAVKAHKELSDTTVGIRAIAEQAITQTTPTRGAPATFQSPDLKAVSQPVAASFGREANASYGQD